MNSKTPYLENHITKQIKEVDIKIKELQSERAALERLLLKARQDEAQEREPIRRNSVNRVLIENRILDALRRSQKPLSNRDLYLEARTVVYDLKETTFRSHIKRMKDAEKIVAKGARWELPEAKGVT
ncbi:hypothetical protein [Pseudaestuariivita atlantica]|uniref:hypothetical protein n=1 Tax=Pseudaestuariivita atlantica TaxID=1317121 RepID=UPI00106BEC7F|nr:hypothetical protein [Pseudaestuariivita atlantica]